jgi:hypothetical protein
MKAVARRLRRFQIVAIAMLAAVWKHLDKQYKQGVHIPKISTSTSKNLGPTMR